jgi:hypothetical protein
MKIIYPVLLLVCLSMSPEILAQTMVIRGTDGSETTESVLAVRKFSFSGENLLLLLKGGDSQSFGLSTLSAIYFKDIPQATGTTEITAVNLPAVYPNPADEVLYFRGLPEGTTTVAVYRLDGTPVLKTVLSSGSSLSVGDLPKGMYFIQFNGQTVKFIKL